MDFWLAFEKLCWALLMVFSIPVIGWVIVSLVMRSLDGSKWTPK